jgi:hypothetical protein
MCGHHTKRDAHLPQACEVCGEGRVQSHTYCHHRYYKQAYVNKLNANQDGQTRQNPGLERAIRVHQ